MLTPQQRRCAVLGDPIAHSLSPVLHRAAYDVHGLGWSYDAHRVPAGGLAEFLAGLDDSWRGLSLTMPLKREALALADDATSRARLAGAANTLVLSETGTAADNTDIPGAAAAIRERYDGPLRRVAIWGGGATAGSVLLALADLGCLEIELLVRDPARAAEAVLAAERHPARPEVRLGRLGAPVSADLLVSTIPPTAQPPLLDTIGEVSAVFEVVYDPWPTPLARWAGTRPLIGGLDLLVHQAVEQFELFTELPAPLEAMRDAGRAALERRWRS